MRPRLVALAVAGLLAARGGAGERGTAPARSEPVGAVVKDLQGTVVVRG